LEQPIMNFLNLTDKTIRVLGVARRRNLQAASY